MTSYWFYKMAAIASQIYFRLLIWPRLKFRKVKSYRHTKFGPYVSIRGRDITTAGFWKQTAAIFIFCFLFRYWPFYWHQHAVFIGKPNFIKVGSSAAELWRHSYFKDGDRQPCWMWFRVMVAHPRCESVGLSMYNNNSMFWTLCLDKKWTPIEHRQQLC